MQKSTKPSTMFFVVSCSDSRLNSPKASSTSLREIGNFGLIFDQTLPFQKKRVLVRIELRGDIVQLAPKSKMA